MAELSCAVPRNVLFDLDGTLLDSLPGIQYSAEAAFRACGIEIGTTPLRSLIGPPIRTILERMAAEPVSREELDSLEQSFRWSYDTEGWRQTPHYEGAAESLKTLRDKGRRLFVVSNKPQHISLRILEAEGTLGIFEEIMTRDSRVPPYNGKNEMVNKLLQKWELDPAECLMVGDTMEDAEAASNNGMPFCLMTHGYGDVPVGSNVPVAFRLGHFSELVSRAAQERAN
jgi:phosphoglycolate phosphatase